MPAANYCRAIHRWSLRSLIGAFLDLGLAYLFLCSASLIFLASKFLSFFHLSLPCPCNGLFGHPDPRPVCLQSLLVDRPTAGVRAVHDRVRTLSPFDGHGASGDGRELLSDRIELGRDLSGSGDLDPTLAPSRVQLGQVDGEEVGAGSGLVSGNSSGRYENKPVDVGERDVDIDIDSEDSDEGLVYVTELEQDGPEIDSAMAIQLLKQALEKERSARAALTLELEKERNASASAADEAMAMILRLQKEKSEIEIEARQYKRTAEEKSLYDLEEMEILKEIIVRREMENFALEKELEECRQVIDSAHLSGEDKNGENEQPDRDSKPGTEVLENQDVNLSDLNKVAMLQGHEENGVFIYDVHVVDDKNADRITEMNLVSELSKLSDGKERGKSSRLRRKLAQESLRRNSEPAVNMERFKLENEVEMLRKRLRLVQKERDRLGFSMDQNKEADASQLRLLDEISRQLEEIKASTEIGQSSNHVSILHPSSKRKHGK